MIAILTATTLSLGFLDSHHILAFDEERRVLWTGKIGTTLDPVRIDAVTNAPRRSIQKIISTHQGELTSVKSPNGGQAYFWHRASPVAIPGRHLSVCRSQDFTCEYLGEDKLLVHAKERTLYCAGRGDGGYIVVTVVADSRDPESADVYRAKDPSKLLRKMSHHPQRIESRLEMLIGNSKLVCGTDGMQFRDNPLHMLDPSACQLEINYEEGRAVLTT